MKYIYKLLIFFLIICAGEVKGQYKILIDMEMSQNHANSFYASVSSSTNLGTISCGGNDPCHKVVLINIHESNFPIKLSVQGTYVTLTSGLECNDSNERPVTLSEFINDYSTGMGACSGVALFSSFNLPQPVNNTIGNCNTLTITKNKVNRWYYKIDNLIDDWVEFPSTYIFQNQLIFIPKNIVGENYFGNIYIKAAYFTDDIYTDLDPDTYISQEFETNIITYTIIPCSPQLTGSPVLTQNICSDSNAGQAQFTFSSALQSDEYFLMTLVDVPTGATVSSQQVLPAQMTGGIQWTWTGLAPGTYYLRYQAFKNGGTAIASAENSSQFTITAPAPVAFSTARQNNICKGGNTGSMTVTATGGNNNYQYSKDGGTTWQASNVFSGLSAGSYAVLVKDTNGCVTPAGAQNTVITEPSSGISLYDPLYTSPLASDSQDGSIEVTVSGGTQPLSYQWKNSAGTVVGTSKDLTNVGAGNYTLTATDAVGCSATETFTLTAPPPLVLSIQETQSIGCYGGLGTLKGIVSGGVSPYTYSWIGQSDFDETLAGKPAGTYTLKITDGNGIVKQMSYTLSQPTALTASAVTTGTSCFAGSDGSIDLTVTGGTAPYSYHWTKSGASIGTTEDLSGLSAGSYRCLIKDANLCEYILDNVMVTEPLVVDGAFTTNKPTGYGLSNGGIILTPSGGTPPYTYLWNTSATTKDLMNIPAGNYTVTITDSKNCVATKSVTLTQPDPLAVSINQTALILCQGDNNGALKAVVSGGVSPYAYEWKKGSTAIGTTEAITNLSTATYTLTVTDINLNTQTVTYVLSEPDLLTASINTSTVGCSGDATGSLTLTPSGGTAPYTYEWTTGETTQTISNLGVGNYIGVVRDAHGCEAMKQGKVLSNSNIQVSVQKQNSTCYNSCDGEIKLIISGGSGDYSVTWNTPTGNGLQATGLCAGSYLTTVKDNLNNCLIPVQVIINQPDKLTLNLGGDKTLCAGQTTTLNATINQPNMTYSWTADNGFTSTNPQVTLSNSGTYKVIATNAQGCQATDEITIIKSTDNINVEMTASSQAYKTKDIVLINISNNASQTYEWLLPSQAQLISQTELQAIIRFNETGTYTIGLKAIKGNCETQMTKEIVIEEDPLLPGTNQNNQEFIKEFSLYPNPTQTNSQFTAKVILGEAEPISFTIYQIGTGMMVNQTDLPPAKEHIKEFNLPLVSGVYWVVLRTPREVQTKKLLVN